MQLKSVDCVLFLDNIAWSGVRLSWTAHILPLFDTSPKLSKHFNILYDNISHTQTHSSVKILDRYGSNGWCKWNLKRPIKMPSASKSFALVQTLLTRIWEKSFDGNYGSEKSYRWYCSIYWLSFIWIFAVLKIRCFTHISVWINSGIVLKTLQLI